MKLPWSQLCFFFFFFPLDVSGTILSQKKLEDISYDILLGTINLAVTEYELFFTIIIAQIPFNDVVPLIESDDFNKIEVGGTVTQLTMTIGR